MSSTFHSHVHGSFPTGKLRSKSSALWSRSCFGIEAQWARCVWPRRAGLHNRSRSMSNFYVAGLSVPEDAPIEESVNTRGPLGAPEMPNYGLPSHQEPRHLPGHHRDATALTLSDNYKSKEPVGIGVEPLNIIILGTSFAGLSCAHHFLDHTIDRLCTTTQASYRLIVIGPSTHLYWNIAAPRALVPSGLVQHEDPFIAVEPGFHRHRGHQFTIIQGSCIAMDPTERSIKVDCYNFEAMKRCAFIQPKRCSQMPIKNLADLTKVQTLNYHALIICTGTSTHSDLLSLHGPHLDTAEALHRFHGQLERATSIVVSGGNCSAVEVAGTLATYLNYKRHLPFRTKRKPPKQITLISGGSVLLPDLAPPLQKKAEKQLLDLGISILHNHIRVIKTETLFHHHDDLIKDEPPSSSSPSTPTPTTTNILLSNGTNILADAYIPCTGVVPNTQFAPSHLHDPRGYLLTHNKSLRVERAGPRTFAVGDVASYSQNYLGDVYPAVGVVMHNLEMDLLRFEVSSSPGGGGGGGGKINSKGNRRRKRSSMTFFGGSAMTANGENEKGDDDEDNDHTEQVEHLQDQEYVQRIKEDCIVCPVTRFGGVGSWMGTRLPSWVVYLFKGRRYRMGEKGVAKVVVQGKGPYTYGSWKAA